KKDLRKKLADVLAQEFDQHLKQQQKELEALEKQIADLRALLKKRVEAKTTIVERRLEQLVQEAEGLGWTGPAGPRSGSVGFSGGSGFSGGGGIGGFHGGGGGFYPPGEPAKPKTARPTKR